MRLRYLTKDCRTFFKVRHDQRDWFHGDHGDRPIGGGNFLTGIGLLSALNFDAKVYLHLVDSKAFSTEEDRLTVKNAVKGLEAEVKKVAQGRRTRWEAPRIGGCNEQVAFTKFAQSIKPTIDLGLADNEEAGEVWRFFRNALAHMGWPLGMVLVLKSERSSPEAERILRAGPKAFWKDDTTKRWSFNVDRLLIEMDAISDWLSEQIEMCPYPERVESAAAWMTKDLMEVPKGVRMLTVPDCPTR